MNPADKDVKKLLKQLERDGILRGLSQTEKEDAEQVMRMMISDMPPELFNALLDAVDIITADRISKSQENFEVIAQQETEDLFRRLGVK